MCPNKLMSRMQNWAGTRASMDASVHLNLILNTKDPWAVCNIMHAKCPLHHITCTVRILLAWAPQTSNMMHCVGGSEALFECNITVCVDGKTYLNGTDTTWNERKCGFWLQSCLTLRQWWHGLICDWCWRLAVEILVFFFLLVNHRTLVEFAHRQFFCLLNGSKSNYLVYYCIACDQWRSYSGWNIFGWSGNSMMCFWEGLWFPVCGHSHMYIYISVYVCSN